ncbi:MAG: InlB B-repeat-containing protein, partial [Clostridia bacterium]
TVTYYVDGVQYGEVETYNYGDALTQREEPTRTGYRFSGWDKTLPATMPAENLEVRGTFTVSEYIVTYYNGTEILGTFNVSAGAEHIIKDDTEMKVVPPEGYVFAGTWKDDNGVAYVIGDIKTINANLNLYAQFKKIEDAESEASSFWQNKVKKYGSSDIEQYGFVGQITPVIVNGDVTNQIFYCKTTDGNIYIRNNGGIDWIKNKETNEDVDCADIIHLVKGNTYLIKENKTGLTITVVVK